MNTKRKLIFGLLLALLCLPQAGVWATAQAQGAQVELYGLVTDVLEGGILLADERQGEVLLNVDAETVLEGILAETPLEKGMYVYAKYNGILTRSLPPQAHADRLACYILEGTVSQVLDGQALLTGDPIFGEALVRLGSQHPRVLAGVPIKVYYNGTMAMSLPPQVAASYVVVPVVTGTVKKVTPEGFSLVTQDQQLYSVQVDGLTLLPSSWFEGRLEGRAAAVYYNGVLEEGGVLRAMEVVDPSAIVQEPTAMPGQEEPQEPDASAEPSQEPGPTPSADASLSPTLTPGPSGTPAPAPGEILETLPSPTPVAEP